MNHERPTSRLLALALHGQSIWLDDLAPAHLIDGELERLLVEDGVRGLRFSAPAALGDVRAAAAALRPLYDRTAGREGTVSVAVTADLAHDTDATIDAGRWLWRTIDQPNALVALPATPSGLAAIQQLVSEGVSVDARRIFGLQRYHKVVQATLAGLEARCAVGLPVDRITSVATFGLGPLDAVLDLELEPIIRWGGAPAAIASQLLGSVAIATAKLAYQAYREVFTGPSFATLIACGARPQRLAWAAASRDTNYSDVMYVDALVGPDTVCVLPADTLSAYRDHGEASTASPSLGTELARARWVLEQAALLDIDLDDIAQRLADNA